jgi:hypothetical protein
LKIIKITYYFAEAKLSPGRCVTITFISNTLENMSIRPYLVLDQVKHRIPCCNPIALSSISIIIRLLSSFKCLAGCGILLVYMVDNNINKGYKILFRRIEEEENWLVSCRICSFITTCYNLPFSQYQFYYNVFFI